MKIKTKADIERLREEIQRELDIDMSEYQNEEVAETFAELVAFPAYILNWAIRPVLISLLLFVMGYFVLHLVHIEYLLYTLIGFALFLACGISFGLIFTLWKLKGDMNEVLRYSLQLFQSILADLRHTRAQLTAENKKYKYQLLYQGIIHIISIPVLSKALGGKIPLIGFLVEGLVKKILTAAGNRFRWEEAHQQATGTVEDEGATIDHDIQRVNADIRGIDAFTAALFKVVRIPFLVVFVISLLLLLLFLALIN